MQAVLSRRQQQQQQQEATKGEKAVKTKGTHIHTHKRKEAVHEKKQTQAQHRHRERADTSHAKTSGGSCWPASVGRRLTDDGDGANTTPTAKRQRHHIILSSLPSFSFSSTYACGAPLPSFLVSSRFLHPKHVHVCLHDFCVCVCVTRVSKMRERHLTPAAVYSAILCRPFSLSLRLPFTPDAASH